MPDSETVRQLLLENRELNRRIALQEENSLEKGKAEKALQDSEKRYRRLFESAKDGILILDADTGEVVDVNPFLTRLLGYPYDTFCGKHLWEIGVFKDVAASKEAFQTLRDHEYIRYEHLPLETHYGNPVDVEFVSNVYQVDNNRVIQCNIRDITERRRAEERIKKGLQLESALRRIDTQIMEGADIREVMGTACEAIVAMGYRMCWIGQPDPERIVRPVAYSGFTDGYPENIDIRWNDSSGKEGPTEIAIRSGTTLRDPEHPRESHFQPMAGKRDRTRVSFHGGVSPEIRGGGRDRGPGRLQRPRRGVRRRGSRPIGNVRPAMFHRSHQRPPDRFAPRRQTAPGVSRERDASCLHRVGP